MSKLEHIGLILIVTILECKNIFVFKKYFLYRYKIKKDKIMKKTSKETVENIVWKACDTFRGSIDSSLYKDYILSMLFVKYLSDFAKEKRKELESKY